MEVSLNEIVEFSNVSSEQGVIPVTVDKICKLPIQEIFQLHAERVAWCDYPLYHQVLCEWIKVIEGKCSEQRRSTLDFLDCLFICECLAEELSDVELESDLYVCKDGEGSAQAMMLLTRKINTIYLTSSPP